MCKSSEAYQHERAQAPPSPGRERGSSGSELRRCSWDAEREPNAAAAAAAVVPGQSGELGSGRARERWEWNGEGKAAGGGVRRKRRCVGGRKKKKKKKKREAQK